MRSQKVQSQKVPSQRKQSPITQKQSSKATFWNNLVRWIEAFDSTARHYQYKTEQNRLQRWDSELREVRGHAGNVESGVDVRKAL